MSHQVNLHDGTGDIASIPGYGKVIDSGTTVPTDGDAGYAPGCLFIDISAGAVYINEGSNTSCDFDAITTA